MAPKKTRNVVPDYKKQANARRSKRGTSVSIASPPVHNVVNTDNMRDFDLGDVTSQQQNISPQDLQEASTSTDNVTHGPSWSEFNSLKKDMSGMQNMLQMLCKSQGLNVDKNVNVSKDSNDMNAFVLPSSNEDISGDMQYDSCIGNSNNGDQMHQIVSEHIQSIIGEQQIEGEISKYQVPGRPVDLKVSLELKNKIWSDQYVDLYKLLDEQPSNDVEDQYLNVVDKVGDNLKVAPPKQKSFTSLGQWCSAFMVYLTIYCKKHPEAISPLTTYMSSVKTLAHRNGNYLMYDREFRYHRQYNHLPWNVIDSGLWLECRDNPHSGNSTSNSGSKKQSSNSFRNFSKSNNHTKSPHPKGYCFSYHTRGECNTPNCRYTHSCYFNGCGGKHPISQCPRKQQNGNKQQGRPVNTQGSANTSKPN